MKNIQNTIRELERIILRNASDIQYRVMDKVPENFETLKAFVSEHGYIPVWSGSSDNTIFSSSEVNYAFRAWHDSVHLKLNVGFDLSGEIATAVEQCRTAVQGGLTADLGRVIMIEVVEQALHFFSTGKFVENQKLFFLNKFRGYNEAK